MVPDSAATRPSEALHNPRHERGREERRKQVQQRNGDEARNDHAGEEHIASSALGNLTTAGRAARHRTKDKGVVLGDGANLARQARGHVAISFRQVNKAVTAARHEPEGSESRSAHQRCQRSESPHKEWLG
jgi:hypothetical protein